MEHDLIMKSNSFRVVGLNISICIINVFLYCKLILTSENIDKNIDVVDIKFLESIKVV